MPEGGTLHLVATPIGNLEDVTLRALRMLREAHVVLAEDTRRTRILLQKHGVAARPVSLHAHNEAARTAEVLAALAAGRDVALVSDAGTPHVSDPGERLVAAAIAAGHRVVPVPGPSAVLAALAASGLAPVPFAFLGFPPRRAGSRRELFSALRERPETLVLFESPRRVGATLGALAGALGGGRRACVARELTKVHEEIARGTLDELAARFAAGARGEVTIVVEGRGARAESERPSAEPDDLDARIDRLAREGKGAKEIAALLAAETGLPRRELYARASRRGPSGKGPGSFVR
jgi:16S rRNA (cytidine1402-2'-O)-methyltransferase